MTTQVVLSLRWMRMSLELGLFPIPRVIGLHSYLAGILNIILITLSLLISSTSHIINKSITHQSLLLVTKATQFHNLLCMLIFSCTASMHRILTIYLLLCISLLRMHLQFQHLMFRYLHSQFHSQIRWDQAICEHLICF